MTTYKSSKFTWNRESKTFVAEHSDLENLGFCFRMVSVRTGKAAEFAFHAFNKDAEGETKALVFHPLPSTLKAMPELVGASVHVLND